MAQSANQAERMQTRGEEVHAMATGNACRVSIRVAAEQHSSSVWRVAVDRFLRVLIGVTLLTLVAVSPAEADVVPLNNDSEVSACAQAASDGVTVWSGSGVKQVASDDADQILLRGAPGMIEFDAANGDDRILFDELASVTITGGPGADTMLVCSMSGLAASFKFGNESTGLGDTEQDILVLEPEVFLDVPEGFTREIMVFGITPQNDRIRLRLPPGVDFIPEHGGGRAGQVVIAAYAADATGNPGEGIFEVVRANPIADVPAHKVPEPLAAYDPALRCADAAGMATAEGRQDGRFITFTQGRDAVRLARVPGERYFHTLDGDDVIYEESSQSLTSGSGADQVVVCTLDEPTAFLAVGPGGSVADFGPDVVVIEAGQLQDGNAKSLRIDGFSPVNDRVILRLPDGLEPHFETGRNGALFATIGDLTVNVWPSNWSGAKASPQDVFSVEQVAAGDHKPVAHEGLPALDQVTCPDPGLSEDYAVPDMGNNYPSVAAYSTGPDRILIAPEPGIDLHDASDGDDLIYVFDPLGGLVVGAGRDADTVAVCGMRSLSLSIYLGDASTTLDRTPDGVVLEPGVFLGVPEGGRRLINIFGANLANDRLLLRLPPGLQPSSIRDTHTGAMVIEVAGTVVTVYRVDDWMSTPAPEDWVAVTSGVPSATETAAGGAFPAPLASPADFNCPELAADSDFATPWEAPHADLPAALFSAGADRVLVAGAPGIIAYDTSDGDDAVFIANPIASTQIDLGRGSDTAIVCSIGEVGLTLELGPNDIQPDLLTIPADVLRNVPAGYTRQIIVAGVTEKNDRIVLEVPDGMEATIGHGSTAHTLQAKVGRTDFFIMTTSDPFGKPVDPGIVVLQQEVRSGTMGGAGAPEANDNTQRPPVSSAKWSFDPTAGQASVTSGDGSLIAIACGERGEPTIAILPDPGPTIFGDTERNVAFRLIIDGREFGREFLCSANGDHCQAQGLPPNSIITAIRRGSDLELYDGSRRLQTYTLKGSNAAIANLASCLE